MRLEGGVIGDDAEDDDGEAHFVHRCVGDMHTERRASEKEGRGRGRTTWRDLVRVSYEQFIACADFSRWVSSNDKPHVVCVSGGFCPTVSGYR